MMGPEWHCYGLIIDKKYILAVISSYYRNIDFRKTDLVMKKN